MDKKKVSQIKAGINSGKYTQPQIAEKHNVSRSAVSNIATGRTHAGVGPAITVVRSAGGQLKSLDIEQQNISLIGQVENLRSERNMLRRQLRATSKRLSLVDSVADDLRELITPLEAPRLIPPSRSKSLIDETLVLVLSDTHCDQVVLPDEVDGLETFNFPIACRRAEVLVEETIKWTQETLSNFRFKNLIILALGDFVSGEIHNHTPRSYFQNPFKSALATAQLFSLMYRDFAPFFEQVEIITISGNHGRLTEKVELSKAAQENYDYLVNKIAEVYCQDMKNVKFVFPNSFSTIVDIQGHKFHCSHGHIAKSSGATWNRAKKFAQNLGELHHGEIHYYVQGHFHSDGIVKISGNSSLLANGAFLATDPYAYQTLQAAGEPTQLVFGVHRHNGVSWRLPLNIRTADEDKGPQRYKIVV